MSGGRASIFSQIQALGGNWPGLIYDSPSTGQPLRVISPFHGIANGVSALLISTGQPNESATLAVGAITAIPS